MEEKGGLRLFSVVQNSQNPARVPYKFCTFPYMWPTGCQLNLTRAPQQKQNIFFSWPHFTNRLQFQIFIFRHPEQGRNSAKQEKQKPDNSSNFLALCAYWAHILSFYQLTDCQNREEIQISRVWEGYSIRIFGQNIYT